MSGKMTLKGLIEEELMEAKVILDNFNEGIGSIIDELDLNEKLDKANDVIRRNARTHLLAALRSYKMKDFDDADNHVHSALQDLDKQEILDLKDDTPRYEARVKLAVIQSKITGCSERIRTHLAKLNQKEGDS